MKLLMVKTSLGSTTYQILYHHETLDGQNKFRVHRHQPADGQNNHCDEPYKFSITITDWMVKTSIEPTITIQQAGQNKYCEQNLNHHISQWSKQWLSLQPPIYGWFTTSFVAQTKSQLPYIQMVKTRVESTITNLRMVKTSIVESKRQVCLIPSVTTISTCGSDKSFGN